MRRGFGLDERPMRWMVAVALAVLATSNLYVPDLGGGPLADPTVISLAVVLLLAAYAWMRDRFRLGVPHLVLGLVALSFLPGLLMAAGHSYGRFKVAGMLAAFAATAAALQLLGPERTRRAVLWVVGVLAVVVSIFVLIFGETETYAGSASIFGINPISLGRMAALGMLLAVLAAAHRREKTSFGGIVDLLGAAVLCGSAVVATGNRGPIVAAGVALLVILLPGRLRVPKPRSVVAVASGLVLAGTTLLMTLASSHRGRAYVGPDVIIREDEESGSGDSGSSGSGEGWADGALEAADQALASASTGRMDLWQESIVLTLHQPIGVGIGDLYGNIPVEPRGEGAPIQYSHNMLLETATEGGWLALAGLVLALTVSFLWLWRDAVNSPTALAMLAVWVFAVVNACLSSDLVGNRLMWVMIGAGLALEAGRRRRAQVIEP